MGKKVLMIDNTVSGWNRSSLLSNEEEYSVDLVQDSDTGLQKLSGQAHDVIIVRETPEAESWQLCERIRRVSSLPLIVISTNASVETSAKAIDAGADYFLRKPFGPLEFLARVRSLLRRKSHAQSTLSCLTAS